MCCPTETQSVVKEPREDQRMSQVLVRGGIVIDPSQKLESPMDILIEDGRFKAIDSPGKIPSHKDVKIIDAKDLWVVPGLVDIHVHLREPGFEYKETIETGTLAAVAGGFTSVACMANTNPVNDNPYVTSFIISKARASGKCRVYPIGAVTKGLKGEHLAEIGGMVREGAVAISDDGMPVMNSYLMRKAMDYAKAFSIPIISHAEDCNLVGKGVMNEGPVSNALGLRGNPAASEEIMVAREIALCRLTRCPTHIAHVSTAAAVKHIQRAKEDGLPITAEVSPHHLFLSDECIKTYDTVYKVAPPLRSSDDQEALKKALAEGVIDIIASDHAPHGHVDKRVEFDHAACGMLGLQTTVSVTLKLVHQKIISKSAWVSALSTRPSEILNIPHGKIKIGSAADLTLIDPQKEWTFTAERNVSKSLNSPFLGNRFNGMVRHTLVGGHVAYSQ